MKKNFRSQILLASVAVLSLGAAGAGYAQAPRLVSPPVVAGEAVSFADLVERVSPAVVSVLVEREVEASPLPSQFEEFFNFRFNPRDGESDPFDDGSRRMQAEGSGFFIDKAGHIVTNNHVVEDADKVSVRLASGEEVEAEVVGTDALTDLAVLKVKPIKNQAYVEFAEGVNLRVGDWVVAVGNPFGLGGTVTAGIVSAIGGQNRQNQYLDFIQIDAPINRGNSGGPTFDLKGRVVGVNTAIFSPNGGSVGIGFAIPAKVARDTVDELIANGSVTRGWLGIQLQEMTTELAAALELKSKNGVLVGDVLADTPAANAGLEEGDLIVAIAGEKVDSPNELSRRVAAYSPGEKVAVKLLRDGKEKVVNVTLGQRDDATLVADNQPPANDNDELANEVGVRVTELNESLRQQFRVPDDVNGVVVTGVKPGSAAEQAGLRPGAVILQVEGQDVTTGDQLRDKIASAKKAGKEAVLMRLQYGANRQFGALSLE